MDMIFILIFTLLVVAGVSNIVNSVRLIVRMARNNMYAEKYYRIYGILVLIVICFSNYVFLNIDFFLSHVIKLDDVLYSLNEIVMSCIIIIGLQLLKSYISEVK